MASVNNQTTKRTSEMESGMGGTGTEGKTNKTQKIPFPETFTVSQGSFNKEMDRRAPARETKKDFLGPDYTSENKNPNNESFAKTKQPKGAGTGLGEIGRLANTDCRTWGKTGNS